MAETIDVIMEGRDIGTNVFPNANVKIYLDATPEERARRRYLQNKENGIFKIIKKEKQNMGIGKKLLEYMEQYAKDKGISSIVLNSGVQRTAAHAFYQNNGYDKRSWCFSKRI